MGQGLVHHRGGNSSRVEQGSLVGEVALYEWTQNHRYWTFSHSGLVNVNNAIIYLSHKEGSSNDYAEAAYGDGVVSIVISNGDVMQVSAVESGRTWSVSTDECEYVPASGTIKLTDRPLFLVDDMSPAYDYIIFD